MSIHSLNHVLPVPTGVDRFGFPTYGRRPANLPGPPNALVEAHELQTVRVLNARASASPEAAQFTTWLSEHGGWDVWQRFAKEYRQSTGFVRGWAGTGMMLLGMGTAALRTQIAKQGYDRLRPYQVDPSIQLIGKAPKDAGYPSGHTSAAYAAASVLSSLWPARTTEFMWWARQTGLSRIHAGAHFPSDVERGAQVGMQAGLAATSILHR
jgi:membrane-associated phospholipid phosphatase